LTGNGLTQTVKDPRARLTSTRVLLELETRIKPGLEKDGQELLGEDSKKPRAGGGLFQNLSYVRLRKGSMYAFYRTMEFRMKLMCA
jgi:hypothetical protein